MGIASHFQAEESMDFQVDFFFFQKHGWPMVARALAFSIKQMVGLKAFQMRGTDLTFR